MCSRSFAIALPYKFVLTLGLNYYREKIMCYETIHGILANKVSFLIIIISSVYKTQKCHSILFLQNFLFQVSFHLQILKLNYLFKI